VDRIYVVDDASNDGTRTRLEEYLSQPSMNHRLEVIRHSTNEGVGKALYSGYKKAMEDGIDVVAVMAGDAQMVPDELAAVIRPVVEGKADYAKGNRLFTGEAWRIVPRHRYLGNAFLSLLTKIASGYWHVADSQAGYTALSLRAIQTLPLEQLYKSYGYPNHLLVMLNVYGFRVVDVPVSPIYAMGEKSGIRLWKVIPTLSWLLLKLFLWRLVQKYVIRDFHPLVFFYFFGAVCLALSGVFFIRMLVVWPQLGQVPQTSFLAFVFLAIAGLQFLLFAMLFDMEHNSHLK